MSTSADVVLDEKIKVTVSEPPRYKVMLLNDDKTPMDFVIGLLVETFKHKVESAKDIMLKVHNEGSGVAGVYSYEIAEQKGSEATHLARSNGFPLRIKLEAE